MMIKGLLPTGHYHCTIRQTDDSEHGGIRVVWTVDEDTDYAWRTLIGEYDSPERFCKPLNVVPYGDYIGMRSKLYVGIKLDSTIRRNVILEHCLPEQPAHFDVTKPKSDKHFYHTKSKRKLPI